MAIHRVGPVLLALGLSPPFGAAARQFGEDGCLYRLSLLLLRGEDKAIRVS